MIRQFTLILRDPTLRMTLLAILIFGTYLASVGIYQSLIAVKLLGISENFYSFILIVALLVSVVASVGIGIMTDQRPNRRFMALSTSALMAVGAAVVWVGQSQWAFILSHMFLIPLSGTFFGQIFAVGRLGSAHLPAADRDGVFAILRGLMGVPFVVVLPIWGALFENGLSLLAIYPVIMLAAGVLFLLIWVQFPKDHLAPWVEVKSGLNFRASLREMTDQRVLIRVMLVGAIHTGNALWGILVGLVFADAGRGTTDVGLFFSLFIIIEVVVTLMIGQIRQFLSRLTIIAIGVFTYAAYIALLPFLAPTVWVWPLAILPGVGGAFVFALAIGYLQDLLGQRAGAGTSLVALQRISSDSLSAASFAIGTSLQGYAAAGILGAGIMSGAMIAILVLDRQGKP